jgi:hypothetical protein
VAIIQVAIILVYVGVGGLKVLCEVAVRSVPACARSDARGKLLLHSKPLLRSLHAAGVVLTRLQTRMLAHMLAVLTRMLTRMLARMLTRMLTCMLARMLNRAGGGAATRVATCTAADAARRLRVRRCVQ